MLIATGLTEKLKPFGAIGCCLYAMAGVCAQEPGRMQAEVAVIDPMTAREVAVRYSIIKDERITRDDAGAPVSWFWTINGTLEVRRRGEDFWIGRFWQPAPSIRGSSHPTDPEVWFLPDGELTGYLLGETLLSLPTEMGRVPPAAPFLESDLGLAFLDGQLVTRAEAALAFEQAGGVQDDVTPSRTIWRRQKENTFDTTVEVSPRSDYPTARARITMVDRDEDNRVVRIVSGEECTFEGAEPLIWEDMVTEFRYREDGWADRIITREYEPFHFSPEVPGSLRDEMAEAIENRDKTRFRNTTTYSLVRVELPRPEAPFRVTIEDNIGHIAEVKVGSYFADPVPVWEALSDGSFRQLLSYDAASKSFVPMP